MQKKIDQLQEEHDERIKELESESKYYTPPKPELKQKELLSKTFNNWRKVLTGDYKFSTVADKYMTDPSRLSDYDVELLKKHIPDNSDPEDAITDVSDRLHVFLDVGDHPERTDFMTNKQLEERIGIAPSEEEVSYNEALDRLHQLETKIDGYTEAYDMAAKAASEIEDDEVVVDEDKINAIIEPINRIEPILIACKGIPFMGESLKSMHDRFVNLEKLRQTAETIGVSKGMANQLLRDYRTIYASVKKNAPELLDQLQTYVDMTNNQKAVENQIKALATYESFLSLPQEAFDNLPESIKKKCIQLMTLKNHLQKVYNKKSKISKKYKLHASNKPVSEDKEHAKVLNPMLNRGYSIFNKVAQHNAYNAGFA